jgi:ABC-type amino acid transport system permease subunit
MDFDSKIFLDTLPSLAWGAVTTAKLAAMSALLGLVVGDVGIMLVAGGLRGFVR